MAALAAAGSVAHRWTVPSSLEAASWPPAGANATENTWPAGPVRVAISDGLSGSVTFQSQTVPSVTPAASVVPSGLNASAQTYPAGPVSDAPIMAGRAGWATFHSRTVLSAPPIASSLPSGVNASPI